MQILVVMMMFLAMTAGVLLGGRADMAAAQQDTYGRERGDVEAARFEAVGRAAWFAAREGGLGYIDTSSLALPPNLLIEPGFPYKVWSDGTFVYVWGGRRGPLASRLDSIFAGADASTVVGLSGSAGLTLRGGATTPRPAAVPEAQVVVRMRL